MIVIKGDVYLTTADAARELGVSTKTIRAYIQKGIIPEPPTITYGIRKIRHFTKEYLKDAARQIERYRQ
ncbi:MAG: helix-turn-helix domain-containing protein [Deltaproteobacteria bacterium]|nr:helix-turn-helix domain-containing protein [Deltaproteobacteria bacterium]